MARKITYLAAINEALDEALAKDERIFLHGENIAFYGWRLWRLLKETDPKIGATIRKTTPIQKCIGGSNKRLDKHGRHAPIYWDSIFRF